MTPKIVVTVETFDVLFSVDDWLNFSEMTNKELYEKMILFVFDDNGKHLTSDEARAAFRLVPKSEWAEYVKEFYKAVNEAFVNPTSAGG